MGAQRSITRDQPQRDPLSRRSRQMQLEQEQTDPSTSNHPQSQADTRLHGGWLLIARVGWLVLTLLVLTLSAIALPRYYSLAQSVCQPGAQCLLIQLRPVDLRLLHQLGLSSG